MLNLIEDGKLAMLRDIPSERRTFTRIPFHESVLWRNASGEIGSAKILDVSRSGLCLSLARYIRPGPAIIFSFEDVLFGGRLVTVPVLTLWSRLDPHNRPSVTAGFFPEDLRETGLQRATFVLGWFDQLNEVLPSN